MTVIVPRGSSGGEAIHNRGFFVRRACLSLCALLLLATQMIGQAVGQPAAPLLAAMSIPIASL